MASKSLYKIYDGYFDIGAAITPETLVVHEGLIREQFNSLTATSYMKSGLIHPEENRYDFTNADNLVNFAVENGKRVRGHNLIWHRQYPEWMLKDQNGDPASRDMILGRMKEHMQTVLGRYKGKVYCWDVVNEAIEDRYPDEFLPDSQMLRDTPWLCGVGSDYLDVFHRMAYDIDPDIQLYYNDYNECLPGKRERIIKLVKGMKERGVPIHGIGMQAHWNVYYPSPALVRESVDMYAELGLRVQITEMDVSCYDRLSALENIDHMEPWMVEKQEELYEQSFAIFREYKDVIDAVTFWGTTDDYSWLRRRNRIGIQNNWPLLFDKDQQPKKLFDLVTNF